MYRGLRFNDLGVAPQHASMPEVNLRSQPSFSAMRSSERLGKLNQNSAVVPEEMGHDEAVSHLIPWPDVVPDFRTLEHFPAYVIHHTNRMRAASQGSTPELGCTSGNLSFRTDSGNKLHGRRTHVSVSPRRI